MDGAKLVVLLAGAGLVALVLGGTSCDDNGGEPDGGDSDVSPTCLHDTSDGPHSAFDLEPGEVAGRLEAEGYICPLGDRDWYRFSVPAGDHLLNVSLGIHGPRSPVQPTYAVYECDEACVAAPPDEGPGSCCSARAAPRPQEVDEAVSLGRPLEVTHCVEPGQYYVVVRDQGDDNQDGREPRGRYHLTVSTAPDPDPSEPNDGPETAVGLDPLGPAVDRTWTASGQIACRGDQDWHVLDAGSGIVVQPRDLLEVRLTAPVAAFQPQFRVIGPDDVTIATVTNAAGHREATDLSGLYWLDAGGRYFVVVEDDDGNQADPGATYQLTVRLTLDPDLNEPNNTPATATDLGALGCAGSWAEASRSGTISATNDIDIYRVGLDASCLGGILEVEAAFGADRPAGLQPSVRVVRSHPETPCAVDTDCRRLAVTCDPSDSGGLDCAGLGNVCLTEGVCAGASLCLPGGVCGATILARHPDFCGTESRCHGPSGAMQNRRCSTDEDCAPQGTVRTAIPLGRNPNPALVTAINQVFLVVQDFGANASSPTARYDLRVRTRADPDTNEPNEVYNPFLTQDNDPTSGGLETPVAWGGCARGYLSYERDQDFFTVPHPCPAAVEGCRASITYSVGGGPVEVYAYVPGSWRDIARLNSEEDRATNPPRSGSIGVTDCLPANGRSPRNPFRVVVRDLDYIRDWDPGQQYEICFNLQSLTCDPPCQVLEGQCWYPD